MKVLVIGSGGREHAIAWRLHRSPRVDAVVSCPGNGGSCELGDCWQDVSASDPDALIARIQSEGVDFVAIGPEDPLAGGLADRLRDAGIATFGPGAAAARLEGSKRFAKDFMTRHGIATARYVAVTEADQIETAVRSFERPPVVKADGLAAGKGVVVADSHEDAIQAAREMLVDRRFGDAGTTVVIEDRLDGVEMTMLVFVSGLQYRLLDSAQDYKPRDDGNEGPNTGGMGSYSPTSLYTAELRQRIVDDVLEPTLAGLESDGVQYRGVLYLGLMLTTQGPQVLEYNVRFGDPETQPLLMRLRTDLLSVFEAIEAGELDQIELDWDPRAALCLILASAGYPLSYASGVAITGDYRSQLEDDVQVFHAGTRQDADVLCTAGGRVVGVTALGANLKEARERAYQRASAIEFVGKVQRSDIGRYGTTQR